jgi:hypothetical protein
MHTTKALHGPKFHGQAGPCEERARPGHFFFVPQHGLAQSLFGPAQPVVFSVIMARPIQIFIQ